MARSAAFGLTCLTFSGLAFAGLFGPSNYDECVLEHLKGVSSDVGARMVAAVCAKQFPAKKAAEKSARPNPEASSATNLDRTKPGHDEAQGVRDVGPFYDFVPDRAK
jgi:hypothetical protein